MTIEVNTGSMFSGKTEETVRQINKVEIAGKIFDRDFLTFNQSLDERYGKDVVGSHDGQKKRSDCCT